MKKSQMFTFKGKYSTYENCFFETNTYRNNGNKYLAIWNEDKGDIVTCSVNACRVNKEDEIGIKNYSENEGMVKFLQDMGIIEKEPIEVERSGFVLIPYFKLTAEGMELFTED